MVFLDYDPLLIPTPRDKDAVQCPSRGLGLPREHTLRLPSRPPLVHPQLSVHVHAQPSGDSTPRTTAAQALCALSHRGCSYKLFKSLSGFENF